MPEDVLMKPRELYDATLKDEYHRNAEEYFDRLVAESGIDKALNATHVKEYKTSLGQLENAKKEMGKVKAWKAVCIVFMILFFIAAAIFLTVGVMNTGLWWAFLAFGLCLLGGILLIVVLATKIRNLSKIWKEQINKYDEISKAALKLCYDDMAPLNRRYGWNIPLEVMEKTTPIIDLDPEFSPERLCYLMERFGMKEETDPDTSVLGVTSGHIQGNPFILERVLHHRLGEKTYHGELTITWTTTYTDSKGNVHTQTHTQTLHASVTKPCPYYSHDTRLIYGSEAAPNLHFSRGPSGMSGKSEKEIAKFVEKRVKELNKYDEKATKAGRHYTRFGNDEFEALFGGEDRDNEVEYRLLFTPLAILNEMDLIKNPAPFGDDFYMVKDGMITSVASGHSQSFDYSANPRLFRHYDAEQARINFVNYCDKFIQCLYFDLAPIISIPLYQLHKPHDYVYGNTYRGNITSFEHEVMANNMDPMYFIPKKADEGLPLLLKETDCFKNGQGDRVEVYSFSYETTPMCDYISVHGGDGRWHEVPVHWTKYDRVDRRVSIGVERIGGSEYEYRNRIDGLKLSFLPYYERGLISFLLNEADDKGELREELRSLFK